MAIYPGGNWTSEEITYHNILFISGISIAIKYGKLMTDQIIAVACTYTMGNSHSKIINTSVKDIWKVCLNNILYNYSPQFKEFYFNFELHFRVKH